MWSLKFLELSSKTLEASAGSASAAAKNNDLKSILTFNAVVVMVVRKKERATDSL